MLRGKRILVGVLNWGLGHASRSVQLISQLEKLKAEVVIASDGAALDFLKREFPGRDFLKLPELKVHYASAFGLQWSIISQIPRLLQSLKGEKTALDNYLKEQQIDLILSDNRYGIFHRHIPSVLLTHQLNLQLKFAKRKADAFMRKLMLNFNEVWIPDEEEGLLSGRLSSLTKLPVPKYFMGTFSHLSRFEKNEISVNTRAKYLAILSGPEPLRSHFEKNLVISANRQKVPLTIVRGSRVARETYHKNEYVDFTDQLTTTELIESAQNHLGLICRSGYSSLMDLSRLGLPALVIPTPGQSEQEYLAKYHLQARQFYSKPEKGIDLKRDLEQAFSGNYSPPKLKVDLAEQRRLMIERFEELLN